MAKKRSRGQPMPDPYEMSKTWNLSLDREQTPMSFLVRFCIKLSLLLCNSYPDVLVRPGDAGFYLILNR